MPDTQFTGRFDMAAKGLCPRLRAAVMSLPQGIKEQAQEIRIRSGRPLAVYCSNRMYYLTAQSRPVTAYCGSGMLIVTPKDVSDTFQSICGYSVYSHQNEIKHGFLTMQGGHRAGLCGTAVYQNGTLSNIRDVSSINIRIARQISGAADKLLEMMNGDFGGLLLCGAPSCGKTTILRDLSRQLSNTYMKKSPSSMNAASWREPARAFTKTIWDRAISWTATARAKGFYRRCAAFRRKLSSVMRPAQPTMYALSSRG